MHGSGEVKKSDPWRLPFPSEVAAVAIAMLVALSASVFAQSSAQSMGGSPLGSGSGAIQLPGPASPSSSQTPAPSAVSVPDRLTLARASRDYPVTPGDIYQLTYELSSGAVSRQVVVDGDYSVNLGVFGTMVASGMTFTELERKVAQKISAGYKNSVPNMEIVSVGAFMVRLTGHVPESKYVQAWGLSHLSDILDGNLGPYSSTRDIQITNANNNSGTGESSGGNNSGVPAGAADNAEAAAAGNITGAGAADNAARAAADSAGAAKKTYDYFRAKRFGDSSQDPLVRPGDVVTVEAAGKRVVLRGEINRPATYQLLPNDDLDTLINKYGDGVTSDADAHDIRIDRTTATGEQTMYADLSQTTWQGAALRDGDTVTVPSGAVTLPVVFFEGAVNPMPTPAGGSASGVGGGAGANGAATGSSSAGSSSGAATGYAAVAGAGSASASDTGSGASGTLYSRVAYRFRPGEKLSDAVSAMAGYFLPNADLRGAVVETPGVDPRPVNLQAMLYGNDDSSDINLTNYDRVIVPAQEEEVAVNGAVASPGMYPFSPNKTYQYYLALAGGADPDRHTGSRVKISDNQNDSRARNAIIRPGDRIFVPSNSFVYNFNRYFPIFATTISVVTAAVTLVNTLITITHP